MALYVEACVQVTARLQVVFPISVDGVPVALFAFPDPDADPGPDPPPGDEEPDPTLPVLAFDHGM
jgi:hypothetical protein